MKQSNKIYVASVGRIKLAVFNLNYGGLSFLFLSFQLQARLKTSTTSNNSNATTSKKIIIGLHLCHTMQNPGDVLRPSDYYSRPPVPVVRTCSKQQPGSILRPEQPKQPEQYLVTPVLHRFLRPLG